MDFNIQSTFFLEKWFTRPGARDVPHFHHRSRRVPKIVTLTSNIHVYKSLSLYRCLLRAISGPLSLEELSQHAKLDTGMVKVVNSWTAPSSKDVATRIIDEVPDPRSDTRGGCTLRLWQPCLCPYFHVSRWDPGTKAFKNNQSLDLP